MARGSATLTCSAGRETMPAVLIVDAQVHIWRQCVTLFTEELPWLTARDKELIMGRALCAWLDWKLPA